MITIGDSKPICQSGAIARFAAKLANIYPADPYKAIYVDEAYDVVTGASVNASTFRLSPDQAAEKTKAWIAHDLARLENFVKERLGNSTSPYIANGEFSLADIAFLSFLSKQKLERGSPTQNLKVDDIKNNAPTVWAYMTRLGETEQAKKIQKKADEFYSQIQK